MEEKNIQTRYDEFKKGVIKLANESLDIYNSCFDENGDENSNLDELFELLEKDPDIHEVYKALLRVDV